MTRSVISATVLIGVTACSAELPPTSRSPTSPPPPVASMSQPPLPASQRPAILEPGASPVDFDRIARFPEPGWQTPRAVAYSPDGKLLTYLQSESQSDEMALFAFDLHTREHRVLVRA